MTKIIIDITPKSADKGKALIFLLDLWGLELNDVIGAGDSMNDLSFLKLTKAILVANCYPEIKSWYEQNLANPIYISNQMFADGIIDGLKHYGIIK